MEQGYLIDTNVLIEYIGNTLPIEAKIWLDEIIDSQFNISVIVGMEVLGYADVDDIVQEFMNLANVIYINKEVYSKTIEIRKKYKIKLPDAIIASTCLVYNYKLISRNINDFKSIKELSCINPHTQQL